MDGNQTHWMKACAAATLVAGLAAAHSEPYVNATGDALVLCRGHISSVGGACFAAGHLMGAKNSIVVWEATGRMVSAWYCQDLNDDGSCGDPAAAEPGKAFCQTIPLTSGVNWNPNAGVYVFVDLVLGASPSNACGDLYSGSPIGHVAHG